MLRTMLSRPSKTPAHLSNSTQRPQRIGAGAFLPLTSGFRTVKGSECQNLSRPSHIRNCSRAFSATTVSSASLHFQTVSALAYLDGEKCSSLLAAFQLWQPKVYRYYAESLEKLYKHLPHLPHIFPRSVYPCTAFNFGKNVWCYKHCDVMNCPFGFCAITALGKFDSTQGGHIILWEPKLIIEFPPGSTILIPSATITHSNIPVQEDDARISFTQDCTGGIFRYVDNGFRMQEALKREDPREYERLETLKGGRWEAGLGLLATMDNVKWNA